jgi:DNA repair exonuclease SbcCD ATPase subunit
MFGGFGELMKGLSGFMPQDDPNVKLMTAQTELNDLQQRETELYAEIGRQAVAQNSGQYPELESKLRLVQANLSEAQTQLKTAQEEKEHKEQEEQRLEEQCTCTVCGYRNSEGVKFCQECGAKLGANALCPSCGAKLTPGVRFCGECGARLEG